MEMLCFVVNYSIRVCFLAIWFVGSRDHEIVGPLDFDFDFEWFCCLGLKTKNKFIFLFVFLIKIKMEKFFSFES